MKTYSNINTVSSDTATVGAERLPWTAPRAQTANLRTAEIGGVPSNDGPCALS